MHILKAAKEYPELKIVVAHAGMGVMAREAVILAQICENVYLEPTWTGVADMELVLISILQNQALLRTE